MEYVESFHFFSRTYEFDGLVYDGTYREGSSASGIAVEFGENDTGKIETIVEGLCRIHGILSCHGIDHEKDFLRIDGFFQCCDFVHHLFIDGEASGCIDDDQIVVLFPGFFYSVLSDFDRFFVFGFGIDGYTDLLAEHSQLFDGGRTVNVAGNEQGALGPFGAQHLRQFTRESGFTRTL